MLHAAPRRWAELEFSCCCCWRSLWVLSGWFFRSLCGVALRIFQSFLKSKTSDWGKSLLARMKPTRHFNGLSIIGMQGREKREAAANEKDETDHRASRISGRVSWRRFYSQPRSRARD